jgi:integrase
MRKTLTDAGVRALKPRPKRYAFPDPQLAGFYVRVTPTGSKSYCSVTLSPAGKQIWTTIGSCELLTIEDAREQARTAIKRVKDGLPALETRPKFETFEDVAKNWLKRHVQAKGLRSEYEVTRLLAQHVYPAWGKREFVSIRRSEVAALLDVVEDNHSARQADAVLAVVRGVMSWYAARSDNYVPPIIRGMRRTNPKERERSRVLDDNELRHVWLAAESNGTFGAFIRMLLLSTQRRSTVVRMKWQDVSADGIWKIATEAREKGNAGEIKLPQMALDIIQAQPQLGDNPHVFAGRGNGPINGFSKAKRQFDAKLPKMQQWQLHDLRRTARSLLSRAGISSDVSERVLGHAIEGVRGVYDRHKFDAEKTHALQALATLIARIVHPAAENVVAMAKPRKRR